MKDTASCIKGLRRYYKPVRGRSLISVAAGAVRIALSLGFVVVSKRLVDIVTHESDAPLGGTIAIFAGILAGQILVALFQNWWSGYITARTQNELREKAFRHVLNSRWEGKEKFLSGDTVNRLEEDIRVVTDLLCNWIPDTVIILLQLVAASCYLMTLAPNLLWILLVLMGVTVFGAKLFFKVLRALTARIREKESQIQQVMQESLQHRVLLKTLEGTERILQRFGAYQEDVVDNTVKRLNYNAFARGLMSLGFRAGYAAAFLWGIFGIRGGTVTYGMMTAFLQLVGQVQRPVADLSRQIPSFIHALTSVERLMELEELPLEKTSEPVRVEGAPEIVLDHVWYTYPGKNEPVLKDFSHTFRPGALSVIAGPTGVGKSTMVRLILGLLEPERGEITIGGHPAGADTRCNLMYIPQGNSLLSGTIRENLLMANPEATEEEIRHALQTAVAGFVFSLPEGLETRCGEVGSGLSEGQSQRIAVARALLRKGGAMILDEATSALDADTENRLLKNLQERYRGAKTILFISHREAVIQMADEVVTLSLTEERAAARARY